MAPDSWYIGKPANARAFIGDVRTFNGALKLKVSHSSNTPPVPLQLSVQNNLANTSVTLDSSYEGTFSAQTKLSPVLPFQRYVSPSADPLGKNRQRNSIYSQNQPSSIRGWIGWGKQPVYGDGVVQGQVKIVSSLSPVMLQFGT